jgi:hypothetical protein
METGPETAEDELRPEYDFKALKGAVRGKYAARYRQRFRTVTLADDIAAAFPDDASVNAALRAFLSQNAQSEKTKSDATLAG